MLDNGGSVTLPETNIFAPKNGWLEYDRFLLGFGLFMGELLVSGRVDDRYFPPSDSMPLGTTETRRPLAASRWAQICDPHAVLVVGRWPVNTATAVKRRRLPPCFPQMDAINLTLGRL